MPEFNIPERQVVSTGGAGSPTRVNQGSLDADSEATRQLGASVGKSADIAFDFSRKLQAAEDYSNVLEAGTKFKTGVAAVLDDFKNRNDFENFESDFKSSVKSLRSEVLKKTMSPSARRSAEQEMTQLSGLANIQANSLTNQKKMEHFEVAYKTGRETELELRNINRANLMAENMEQLGLLNRAEMERDIAENEQKFRYYEARDIIQLDPADAVAVSESFGLNEENQIRLQAYAAEIVKERKDKARDTGIASLMGNLSADVLDYNGTVAVIDEMSAQGVWESEVQEQTWRDRALSASREQIEQIRTDQATAQDERMELLRTERVFDLAKEKALIDQRIESGAISDAKGNSYFRELEDIQVVDLVTQIEAAHEMINAQLLTGEITSTKAFDLITKEMEQFKSGVDRRVTVKALDLINNIKKIQDTNVGNRKKFAYDFIFDTFPPEIFGEAGTMNAADRKEWNEDQSKKFQKMGPEERARFNSQFIADQNKKNKFFVDLMRAVDHKIGLDPEISDEELSKYIRERSQKAANENAFREASMDLGILGDTSRLDPNPPRVTTTLREMLKEARRQNKEQSVPR